MLFNLFKKPIPNSPSQEEILGKLDEIKARKEEYPLSEDRKAAIEELKTEASQRIVVLTTIFVIAFLLSGVVVVVENGIWKAKWLGIGKDEEITTVKEYSSPAAGGDVSKYTVTTKDINAKTFWDWSSLLGVPLALSILAAWFQNRDKKREATRQLQLEQIADDKQKDEILKNYFNNMTDLLLTKQLRSSKEEDDVQNVAHILTIATFRQLDSNRNKLVTQLLQGSKLINVLRFTDADLSGTDLSGTDLRNAYLGGANLRGAKLINTNLRSAILVDTNLSGANLRDADLNGAKLWGGANLRDADLSGANLRDANLHEADLSEADLSAAFLSRAKLSKANLRGANLSGAFLTDADLTDANLTDTNLSGVILMGMDLRQAKKLIQQQLEGEDPPLLCNVDLPEGFPDKDKLKYRDCNRLPQILNERYSEEDAYHFKELEDARSYVESYWKQSLPTAKKPLENEDLEEVLEN